MKPLKKPSTPQPSSTASPAASPRTRWLFVRLGRIHGDRWLAQWDGQRIEDVEADWTDALARFDDAAIRLALDAWLVSGSAHPPNLTQFVSLCVEVRPQPSARPALVPPRPPAPEGIFDRLRRELNKRKPDDEQDE